MPNTAVATPPVAQPPMADPSIERDQIQSEQAAAAAKFEQQRETAQAPMRQGVTQASQGLSAEVAKPLEQVDLPKNTAQHLDPKQMTETAGLMMTLGAFMGLASRQPFTAALGNMTAAMKGVQEGDDDQYNRSFEEFKTNFDAGMKQNKALIDKRKTIIDDKSLDLTAKIQALHMADLEYDAQFKKMELPFVQRMKQNDAHQKTYDKVAENGQKHIDKLEEIKARAAEARALKAAVAGGTGTGGALKPSTVDFYAAQSLSGDNSWQVGLARGKVGQQLIAAVKDRIPSMAAERGVTPQEVSAMKPQRDALASTLKQRQQALGAAQQFIGQFKNQTKLVEKYLEPGLAGSVPVFNKWIQAGRKSIAGDTDVTNLDTLIRGMAREHQRIVTGVTSNAQLHVSAQETADSLVNNAFTADQVRGQIKMMTEEADAAVDAGKSEVGFLTEQLKVLGSGAAPAAGSAPAAKPAEVKRPEGVPPGAKYSPSRNEWWLDGKKVG